MKTDQATFLLELSSLLKKNRATIEYTNDDDGLHISVAGEEVFVGFLFGESAGDELYNHVVKEK